MQTISLENVRDRVLAKAEDWKKLSDGAKTEERKEILTALSNELYWVADLLERTEELAPEGCDHVIGEDGETCKLCGEKSE